MTVQEPLEIFEVDPINDDAFGTFAECNNNQDEFEGFG